MAAGGRIAALAGAMWRLNRAVYAAGNFSSVNGVPANNVARWDGQQWSALGSGLQLELPTLVSGVQVAAAYFDDGSGPALYVGGDIVAAGGLPTRRLARYRVCSPCYANCDGSTTSPVLNVNDFVCFNNRFAAGDTWANCDGSTTAPILNVNDFVCFNNRFAAGCSNRTPNSLATTARNGLGKAADRCRLRVSLGCIGRLMMNAMCVRAVLVSAGQVAAVSCAWAQGPEKQVRLERMRHAVPGAGARADHRAHPAFPLGGIDNLQAQVNVNGSGMNILGDAANEPSMAVDPTAPNRIAIGWRQFDTINSSFRQAGRAWSNDGGRTWHNPGPLDPGLFRSDPVLRMDKNGVLFYLSLTNTGPGLGYSCQTFKSTDGGMTYGPAVQATGGDKSWYLIDQTNSTGSGFQYQPWSLGGLADQAFSRSTNAGATWLNPPVTPVPVWGTLDVNSTGISISAGWTSRGAARRRSSAPRARTRRTAP
jgi:hypothetical protein